MSAQLKIQKIPGNVATQSPQRAAKDGREYDSIIPTPNWKEETVKRNASVEQTVGEMQKLIHRSQWQTARLAPLLRSDNTYTTCKNIWNFLYDHIKYKEDDKGKEQLRQPAVSWAQRRTRGIDCDDFSIFASCLLLQFKIPHYIRIARYAGVNHFQHVYIVVPIDTKNYITIDAVLDEFDTEKTTAETKDYKVMETQNNLNGVDISVLSGIEDESFWDIAGILSGADFSEVSRIEGLGQVPTKEQELQALYNHLLRTRDAIAKNPALIKEVEDPKTFLQMLDYALKYWYSDKRDEALQVLVANEDKFNNLLGLEGVADDYEEASIFYGATAYGGINALGKISIKKGFFKKVADASKKAGQGIKKAAQAIIRYSPVSIAARAGLLLALKTNLFKMASRLKWGYAAEAEAKEKELDMQQWANAKEALKKSEDLFVKILQGDINHFRDAILKGRAGGLNGTGLGIEPVSTAAAGGTVVASATPFITKILEWLKTVDFKKLFAAVQDIKLKKEGEDLSTVPDPQLPATTESTDVTTNETDTSNAAKDKDNGTPKDGIIDQIVDYAKENKMQAVLIVGGLALLLSKSLRQSVGLGNAPKGRKKKGKKKTNAPKVLTGPKRPAQGKKKGKGGKPKVIKL